MLVTLGGLERQIDSAGRTPHLDGRGHCVGDARRLHVVTVASVACDIRLRPLQAVESRCQQQHASTKNHGQGAGRPPTKPQTPAPVSSCAGLLWFTSEMKSAGRPPYCFGRRGELKAGAEALEKIAKNDDQQKDDKPSEGFTYACLGYAQATAKMTREGKLPLCDVGVRFALLRAADTNEQRKKKALAAARRRDTVGTTAGISPRDEDELSKKASGSCNTWPTASRPSSPRPRGFGWRLYELPGKIWQFYGQDDARFTEPHEIFAGRAGRRWPGGQVSNVTRIVNKRFRARCRPRRVVLSRRRRGISSVRRRRPKRVVLGLLNGSERAERRPPHVREAHVGVAAPELRLAPVPRREGRRRHAVE